LKVFYKLQRVVVDDCFKSAESIKVVTPKAIKVRLKKKNKYTEQLTVDGEYDPKLILVPHFLNYKTFTLSDSS